jgi:hypothetical protein
MPCIELVPIPIRTNPVFIGITLFLATPSMLALLNLSDKYATAASENQKNQLIAAEEAILASDMWQVKPSLGR